MASQLGSIFRSGLFANKVAVVTGGGTGIGYSIAEELASLGCKVVIAARNLDRITAAAAEINAKINFIANANGEQSENNQELVHAVNCNIKHEEDVDRLMGSTVKQHGRLDFLVNNGGGQFVSEASQMKTKGWRAVIDTNLNGTFYCCRSAFDNWMEKEGGSIVNIVLDFWNGFPGMSHSSAARAGVANLTKSLSQEWAPNGIRINSVAPGTIYSDTAAANYKHLGDDFMQQAQGMIPLKRLGTTDEVSSLVCFLLSPGASYITGDTIKVDGGQSSYGQTLYKIRDHQKSEPFTRVETKSNL